MESAEGMGGRREASQPGGAASSALPRVALGTADLWILGVLLALTATFGKPFSTIGFDSASIYITEVALAAAGGLALLRLGPRGFVDSIRDRVPLIPLAFFWLAGIVAVIEGIRVVGLGDMIEDIGLGEYSLLIPLIAAVASTTARAGLLTRILAAGLVGGTLIFLVSDISVRIFDAEDTLFDVQEITFGLYMSMLVAYVAARLSAGEDISRAWIAAGGIALLLVFLTNARGVWISAVVGFAVVAVLNPPGKRLRVGAIGALSVACAFGLALGIQLVGGDSQITREVSGAVRGIEVSDADAENAALDGPNGPSYEESDNTRWRIAFWGEMVERSVDNPVFGVGFGEPIAFTWEGEKYDFRDGDAKATLDIDGPHNEYLHILYRMGYVGFLALVALIVASLIRVRRALRIEGLDPQIRTLIVALTAMWAAAGTVSFFADALKAPFLALFFWASLGLLLAVCGGVRAGEEPATAKP